MNEFMNIAKAIELGGPFWSASKDAGMIDIVAEHIGNGRLRSEGWGGDFINMSSYSYLGLDSDQDIVQAAANTLIREGTLNTSISRVRIRLQLLKDAEDALSSLFNVEVFTTASCAAAAAAALPLIASGAFTDGVRPLMVFDKNAHFCLNLMKPICADETAVATTPHNDLNFIEDLCKKNSLVAYVADGVYSTGGCAPVEELFKLQEKYGLFLFFDEAHGISAFGKNGRGIVLEARPEINARTIIVTSLNKGFGASGGAIFFAPQHHRDIMTRFGGPLTWSQRINTAGLGAILASVSLHKSERLVVKQRELANNIAYFDELLPTEHAGDGLPIRLVPVGEEGRAVSLAQELMRGGFYTSPLFFPIIARGKAGLRVMIRSNLDKSDITRFASLVKSGLNWSRG
ncbi:aminotransferase class I/II-fold pyridoxal phosphate-dependent enzyme [Burkholderia vietnamiensis]|uniref:aminotransferase class I/II-fold pyridoxal phosphate-dependent enzyme n=1 Tax=Burkholderia vietnamiensis TaxID=60552 RepID=UPI00158C7E11|nr:aminotransferase class I/II-fold pyridoxal phosphate-dependent enzyme [Burkholderia vietnamiensis]